MDPKWSNTVIGISSRCDEPAWARELLEKFEIDDGEGGSFMLGDAFDTVHITKGIVQKVVWGDRVLVVGGAWCVVGGAWWVVGGATVWRAQCTRSA